MSETDPSSDLNRVLELEPIETNMFRGINESREGMGPRLFGGQVLAQSLAAAGQTVEADRPCHSLHAYFMRPGDAEVPVLYTVERIRDGRSFTTRRIVAVQRGEAIFSMDASFQLREEGLSHQIDMGDFPDPEEVEDDSDAAARLPDTSPVSGWARRKRPFDFRSVYPIDKARPESSEASTQNPVWIRFRGDVKDGQAHHQQLLAYASDMGLVSTSMLPHAGSVNRNRLQMASLDHALWFHRDVDVQDWLIFIKETPTSSASRGFNRASFYTRDGILVASALQEGLMRVREE